MNNESIFYIQRFIDLLISDQFYLIKSENAYFRLLIYIHENSNYFDILFGLSFG